MNVSPFQLLKRNSGDALAARAGAALAQWGTAWTTLPDHALACAAASEQASRLAAGELRCRQLDGGKPVWAVVPAGMERYLEQLMFGLADLDAASGRNMTSRLGGGVAEDALEDLLQTLFHALSGSPSKTAPAQTLPAQLTRPGSGAVVCSVQLGERALRLLLPATVLPAPGPLRARPGAVPLTSLHRALAALPVPLSVELCRTELTLGYLRTLAVGDVLALPMATDQELRVTGPGDTTVCHAHLGALDGAYAVELIKAAR